MTVLVFRPMDVLDVAGDRGRVPMAFLTGSHVVRAMKLQAGSQWILSNLMQMRDEGIPR